jgi:2,4-dienoyl-CoA reductase-like NADH-dependent reductase (Old Yellow Enzyme family)
MSTAKTDRTLDGLELHSAHGYLLDSFLRAGRVDYVCDLVREICLQLGPGYPIALRFSQWTVRDLEARQFQTPQELEQALIPLKNAGVDIFHASTRRFWLPEFPDSDLNLAGWTRKITDAPTITVGNVGLDTSLSVVQVLRAPVNCCDDIIMENSTWSPSVGRCSVTLSGA